MLRTVPLMPAGVVTIVAHATLVPLAFHRILLGMALDQLLDRNPFSGTAIPGSRRPEGRNHRKGQKEY